MPALKRRRLRYAIRKKQAFIQDVTRVHVEKGTTVAHAIMEQRQWELKLEAAALVDFGQVQ